MMSATATAKRPRAGKAAMGGTGAAGNGAGIEAAEALARAAKARAKAGVTIDKRSTAYKMARAVINQFGKFGEIPLKGWTTETPLWNALGEREQAKIIKSVAKCLPADAAIA